MLPSVGFIEMAVIGIIAVLLFGKRLPEIARSLGQGYQELRKGLSELQSSIDLETPPRVSSPAVSAADDYADDYVEPTAAKLEMPGDGVDDASGDLKTGPLADASLPIEQTAAKSVD